MDASLIFKDWKDFYAFYAKYIPCGDTGAIAEGYSDQTEQLLSKHWGLLNQLGEIVKSHPDFEKFLLSHIDETTSMEGGNKIQYLADKKCPSSERDLCKAIYQRMTTLEEEIKKEKDSQNSSGNITDSHSAKMANLQPLAGLVRY